MDSKGTKKGRSFTSAGRCWLGQGKEKGKEGNQAKSFSSQISSSQISRVFISIMHFKRVNLHLYA